MSPEPGQPAATPGTGPGSRRSLPLLTHYSANRAATTCRYRCGNQCAHDASNTSNNAYFGDIVQHAMSRRGALRAAGVLALGTGGAVSLAGAANAHPDRDSPAPGSNPSAPGTNFTPVAPNTRDAVTVPDGYRSDVVIRWGDPILPDGPKFDFHRQHAPAQNQQFGYNNDFAELVPLDADGNRNLLVVNHEYTTEPHMFPDYDEDNPTEEQFRTALAAHGLSVLLVEFGSDGLKAISSPYNRRITLETEFEMRGPAAGSDHLVTTSDPSGTKVVGTQNNCGGGRTPWGTILSGEENIHQYFAFADQVTDAATKQRFQRYGITTGPSERGWERFDKRWDVRHEPNEPNRFGWVVEIDPHDPNSTPVKHTALGRFKHEAATIQVADDGRVVAYSGDDERFEYIYKFVSSKRMKPGPSTHARRYNMRLLDEGTLYVARFDGNSPEGEIDGSGKLPADGEFDGGGEWLPLASGQRSFVPGFSAEEVYIFTRAAADVVQPTKMDRPEDVEPNPVNGRVYCALTNNTNRGNSGNAGADEPNPRVGNKHGHVLELAGDPAGTRFTWRLLLVCGDPGDPSTHFAGFDRSRISPISCPDNVAFDPHGNLWIATDGNELGSNDGLFVVPVDGPQRGHLKQFLTVPVGAETCGPVITEDFVLVCVQHPGEDAVDPARPTSHWPDGGNAAPRPAVVAVRRAQGGAVGW